jgi:hypothetical protein
VILLVTDEDVEMLSEPDGELEAEVVTESEYDIVGIGDVVERNDCDAKELNVCVTDTVFVTPVGNVVWLAVNVLTVEPVAETEEDLVLKAVIEYDVEADCVFDADALAVIVAVLYIDNDCLDDVVIVERDVDVLEARDEPELVGDAVIVLELLDDALTVLVLKLLLVGGAFLVTVELIVTLDEYDPEKLGIGLVVRDISAVRLLELVVVLLSALEPVLVTVTVLVIRELTELVLDTVSVRVTTGV